MKLRFRQVVASDGTLQPGDVIETSYKEIYIICQQRKQSKDLPQPTITRSKVPIHSEANCRSSNEGRSSERPRMEVAICN